MESVAKNKIIKKGIGVTVIVLFGKVLGFIKQTVIAWAFGANVETDLYFAADSYIAMFGQIQMSSISPSILTEYIHLKESKKEDELGRLLKKCFLIFPAIAMIIVCIIIILSGQTSRILGLSFTPEQRTVLQRYIIYLCPVVLFTSVSGVSNGVLDANEEFVPSKLLSLFFSVSIILSIYLLKDKIGINSLLVGFLIGYSIHTIYVSALSLKYIKKSKAVKKDEHFKRVLKRVLPLVIGNSIVDLGHFVDRIIASSLNSGNISYLYYGQVISNDIINSVFITTIGTILLPSLTKIVIKNKKEEIAEHINYVLSATTLLLFAATGLYIVEGNDLIKLFFERGSFTPLATANVYNVAVFYSLGFVFISIREIMTKVHFAYKDTYSPMKNGVIGVGINLILSFILSRLFGVSGIAAATSVSIAIVSLLMSMSLKKHIGIFPLNSIFWKSFFKSFICFIIMITVGVFLKISMKNANYLVRMFIISFLMLVTYFVCIAILRKSILSKI